MNGTIRVIGFGLLVFVLAILYTDNYMILADAGQSIDSQMDAWMDGGRWMDGKTDNLFCYGTLDNILSKRRKHI